jgi:hypothetical protein
MPVVECIVEMRFKILAMLNVNALGSQPNGFPPALHMHGFMKWQRAPTILSRKGPAVEIPPQIAEYYL